MSSPEMSTRTATNKNPGAEHLREYFTRVAPVWEKFQRKNYYYHDQICDFVQSMVPPGKQVLEIGSGTGELLLCPPTYSGYRLEPFESSHTFRAGKISKP